MTNGLKGQLQLSVGKPEAAAVQGGGAVRFDGGTVRFGGVAFVLVPAVMGVLPVGLFHPLVAVGLGQDRGGGYAEVGGVAFYDAVVGQVFIAFEAVTIYE